MSLCFSSLIIDVSSTSSIGERVFLFFCDEDVLYLFYAEFYKLLILKYFPIADVFHYI